MIKQDSGTCCAIDTLESTAITEDVSDIDTAIIANTIYIGTYIRNSDPWDSKFLIKNEMSEIVYERKGGINFFEFTDFNDDGYMDVIFFFHTNVPGMNELVLFDPKLYCFTEVLNFDSYPSSQKIKGTNFYFSYSRAGCADFNWMSDLYYIQNYKVYPVGHIKGLGCEIDDDTMGIYIYKTKDTVQTLIKTCPIDTITKFDGYKWEFIEKYWAKNYRKFVN